MTKRQKFVDWTEKHKVIIGATIISVATVAAVVAYKSVSKTVARDSAYAEQMLLWMIEHGSDIDPNTKIVVVPN